MRKIPLSVGSAGHCVDYFTVLTDVKYFYLISSYLNLDAALSNQIGLQSMRCQTSAFLAIDYRLRLKLVATINEIPNLCTKNTADNVPLARLNLRHT